MLKVDFLAKCHALLDDEDYSGSHYFIRSLIATANENIITPKMVTALLSLEEDYPYMGEYLDWSDIF